MKTTHTGTLWCGPLVQVPSSANDVYLQCVLSEKPEPDCVDDLSAVRGDWGFCHTRMVDRTHQCHRAADPDSAHPLSHQTQQGRQIRRQVCCTFPVFVPHTHGLTLRVLTCSEGQRRQGGGLGGPADEG